MIGTCEIRLKTIFDQTSLGGLQIYVPFFDETRNLRCLSLSSEGEREFSDLGYEGLLPVEDIGLLPPFEHVRNGTLERLFQERISVVQGAILARPAVPESHASGDRGAVCRALFHERGLYGLYKVASSDVGSTFSGSRTGPQRPRTLLVPESQQGLSTTSFRPKAEEDAMDAYTKALERFRTIVLRPTCS